jgi:hypothetical protein
MEPIKPEHKQKWLSRNLAVSSEDIHEYELLLSRRFTTDPDFPQVPKSGTPPAAPSDEEKRLQELADKIFGAGQVDH